MSASITVDQIRTEIAIHEYGLVTEVQFMPLYKTPKFCNNYVKPADIKSAAITIRKPADETMCRENFLYWRVRSGKSCVVKPAAFKDPLFEFWHLKPYEETTSEIRESVDELTCRLEELRRIVYTLLVEKYIAAHRNKMGHVFEELTEKTVFEYRGYTENGCNENTGIDTVTTLSKRIVFNYCVNCGEHLDKHQHDCNFKLCTKCYNGFARNQAYNTQCYHDECDYECEEDREERLREDRWNSYLDRHDERW
jgi:hypothetical protein